jgi:hypothetical protein
MLSCMTAIESDVAVSPPVDFLASRLSLHRALGDLGA